MPARMREEVAGDRGVKREAMLWIFVEPACRRRVIGPVDEERFADHVGYRNISPVATVTGIVTVIAHGEEFARRDGNGAYMFVGPAERPLMPHIRLTHYLTIDE